jgi:hypothetical protein
MASDLVFLTFNDTYVLDPDFEGRGGASNLSHSLSKYRL